VIREIRRTKTRICFILILPRLCAARALAQGKNPVTFVAEQENIIPDYAVTFTYVARDAVTASNSREAMVHILVRSPEYWNTIMRNKAPVAEDMLLRCDEGSSVAGELHAEDDFDTKEQLVFSIDTPPEHGTVELDGFAFVYTPDPTFWGRDSFTFQVTSSRASLLVASRAYSTTGNVVPLMSTT
jgi:hypothetical protein